MSVCSRRRRRGILVVAAAMMLAVATAGSAGDFGLELTAASSNFDFDAGADWGLWNPSKYDAWRPDSDGGFTLLEGRAIFGGQPYSVFFAAERVPRFDASGVLLGGDPTQVSSVEVDARVYDLVIAQDYGRHNQWGVTPWLGVTHMTLDETRRVPASPELAADTASSTLWGGVLGVDAAVMVWRNLALSGRAAVRWAQGKRDAILQVSPGDPQLGTVELSDTVTRTEVGFDAGLRWAVLRDLHVEAGWRLRDWSGRDGPGSYSGPYVRTVIGF